MSMFRACSSLVAALLLVPALAQAQPQPERAPASATPRDQYFIFPTEDVQASLPRPDQATVRAQTRHASPSLLRHRAHFIPEMLRSVEQL